MKNKRNKRKNGNKDDFEVRLVNRPRCVLYDKNGFHISVRQAFWKLRRLRYLKATDREFYELNSLWYDEDLLNDFLKEYKKESINRAKNGNTPKILNKISVLNEAQNKLLNLKIPKVCPDTYPCGVLIKSLEG